MALFRRTPNQLRERQLATVAPGPVADFLAIEFPELSEPVNDLPLLALDVETTGLDAAQHRIVSIGFVPIDNGAISLAEARHVVVRHDGDVGQSATIHGLTDDAVAAGIPLTDALEMTLEALAGRVLLAHHAAIEIDFLQAACQREFRAVPVFAAVDTLQLGQRYLENVLTVIPRGQLRLFSLRQRFGLPQYKAHNAAIDAMACAELFLALVSELGVSSYRKIARK